MKRFTILAIMALFLLGTVATASAFELDATGTWRVHADWWNQNGLDKTQADDVFGVQQRARTQFDFIANENLKGVLQTEIGTFNWGNGAGLYGNSNGKDAIEVRRAYLDFNVPNTEVQVTAGLQPLTLPGFVGGSPLFSDNAAGIVATTPITDMVSITAGWARLIDSNTGAQNGTNGNNDAGDDVDLGFLAVPLTFDGVQVVPYFGYVWAGKAAKQNPWNTDDDDWTNPDDVNPAGLNGNANAQPWMDDLYDAASGDTYNATGDASAMYFGVPVQVSMFDPLVVSADFHYGSMKIDKGDGLDGDDVKIRGWLADLAVEYNMDMMTPMVFASYSTGLDESDVKDGKFGIYPGISGFWAVDTMLTDGGAFGEDLWLANPVSMWTMGARLKDMSFVEDLSHEVGIIYARGTSDKEVADYAGQGDTGINLLNKDESIWAADFVTRYQMYENLAAIAELGYAKYDADFEGADNEDDYEDGIYKGVLGLQYSF